MKLSRPYILLFVFFLLTIISLNGQSVTEPLVAFNDFFKSVVTNNQVQYKSIEKKQLDELVKLIEQVNYQNLPSEAQKAHLINTYNLLVIKAVKEQYPIASPQEVTGFFDWKKYNIGGQHLTLNELEKELLLKRLKTHDCTLC